MKASIFEFIAVILAGVVWIGALLIGTALAMFVKHTLLIDEFIFFVLGCIAISLVCLFVINICNKRRDMALGYIQSKKKQKVYRWVKNIVFSSLILICLKAMIELLSEGQSVSSQVSNRVWIVILAIVFAIMMYIRNYGRLIDDFGNRLHKVMYRFVLNRTRRYTLLVERCQKGQNGFELYGNIHGEIRVGDVCFLFHPHMQGQRVKVLDLVENGTHVRKSKDTEVMVVINGRTLEDSIPTYAVLTSMLAYNGNVLERVIHNEEPYIVGSMEEYPRFYNDNTYYNSLIFAITHGTYIAIGTTEQEIDTKIMDRPRNGIAYGLHSISPIAEKLNLLPVFTDWYAASLWTDTINHEKTLAVPLTFQKLVDIMRQGNFDGIAINPFGPKSNTLRKDMIEEIVKLPSYQKDFNQGEKE